MLLALHRVTRLENMFSATASGKPDLMGGPERACSAAWAQVVPVSVVFLAACAVFFAQLGAFPLFNPDESLYAEPAREMLDTGEYITTLLNYDVRFTKP